MKKRKQINASFFKPIIKKKGDEQTVPKAIVNDY